MIRGVTSDGNIITSKKLQSVALVRMHTVHGAKEARRRGQNALVDLVICIERYRKERAVLRSRRCGDTVDRLSIQCVWHCLHLRARREKLPIHFEFNVVLTIKRHRRRKSTRDGAEMNIKDTVRDWHVRKGLAEDRASA